MDDSLCGWSIWGVQNLPHEQRLQSSPDHPGNGAGLEASHHVVTIGSWRLNTETFSILNLVWQEKKGCFQLLWTRTWRVVISRERFAIAVVAMVSKQGLVVVVFIPVERLDFEAASLGVSTDDSWHSLVHLVWGACGICSQIQDFLTHILPTIHIGKLERGGDTWIIIKTVTFCGCWRCLTVMLQGVMKVHGLWIAALKMSSESNLSSFLLLSSSFIVIIFHNGRAYMHPVCVTACLKL